MPEVLPAPAAEPPDPDVPLVAPALPAAPELAEPLEPLAPDEEVDASLPEPHSFGWTSLCRKPCFLPLSFVLVSLPELLLPMPEVDPLRSLLEVALDESCRVSDIDGVLFWLGFAMPEYWSWLPREAPDGEWKVAASSEKIENQYPRTLGPNWLEFDHVYTTRAIRLRMTKSIDDNRGHGHMKGNAKEGRRVWLGEIMALQSLERAELSTAILAPSKELAPPPIPVRFTFGVIQITAGMDAQAAIDTADAAMYAQKTLRQ